MPQFNSLSSFQHNGPSMERYPDFTPVFPPITAPSSDGLIEQSSFNTTRLLSTATQSLTTTDQIQPMQPVSGPLHDVSTTQSLIAALQATMAPSVTRTPVVIPGAKKRKRATDELTPARRISPHLRHGIILGAIVAVMITTLISLAPLKGGQASVPLISGAADWVQAQQQGRDITGHTFVTLAQANATPGNAPVTAPATNPVQPPMVLSTSQYVAIARQDAIANGISPDYFVRQIQVESGFNANAVSPSGAVGIAQFLPSTAAGQGFNPYNPITALAGAAKYMANLAIQYRGDYAKALAAYNAGSGTVQYAVAAGGGNWISFLPGETQQYLLKIMGV